MGNRETPRSRDSNSLGCQLIFSHLAFLDTKACQNAVVGSHNNTKTFFLAFARRQQPQALAGHTRDLSRSVCERARCDRKCMLVIRTVGCVYQHLSLFLLCAHNLFAPAAVVLPVSCLDCRRAPSGHPDTARIALKRECNAKSFAVTW